VSRAISRNLPRRLDKYAVDTRSKHYIKRGGISNTLIEILTN